VGAMMKILKKSIRLSIFVVFYLKELILSNFRVLHDVLTPRHYMKPGFIALPLDAKTDLEIFILANLISMTPGTLSVEVSEDRKNLFLHVMYLDDAAHYKQMIKDKFESRVMEVLR
jgi:multicomponent Na+:H+ antiporter subunit E